MGDVPVHRGILVQHRVDGAPGPPTGGPGPTSPDHERSSAETLADSDKFGKRPADTTVARPTPRRTTTRKGRGPRKHAETAGENHHRTHHAGGPYQSSLSNEVQTTETGCPATASICASARSKLRCAETTRRT